MEGNISANLVQPLTETVGKVVRENHLNKTDEMRIKMTEEEIAALLAAIRTGDKAEQERIVREIVAAQTTR